MQSRSPDEASVLFIAAADEEPSQPAPWRVTAAAIAGNAIEFYDFIIYSFFALYIGRTFFPFESEFGSLLASVATFGVGFATRPLGALMIGAYADQKGRKAALILTVTLMTIATMGIAFTPSYESIGLAAPVLLVIWRLIQGFALGGEVGPATALLIERSPVRQRGFYASWQLASQGIAIGVGGAVGFAVTAALGPEQLGNWGWRIPFVLGLVLVPVAFYIRKQLPEAWPQAAHANWYSVVKETIEQRLRHLLLGLMAMMCAAIAAQIVSYMTTYAIKTLKLPPTAGQGSVLVAGLATIAAALGAGALCDRYGRKSIMWIPCTALLLLIVPLFWWINASHSIAVLLLSTAIIATLATAYGTACLVAIPEAIPRTHRATSISIMYGCGTALFGGSAQFLIVWLSEALQDPLAPAYYMALSAGLSLMAISRFKEAARH